MNLFTYPLEKILLFAIAAHSVLSDLPIRSKTQQTYGSMLRNHVFPFVGNKNVSEVSRQDIQKLLKPLPSQTAAMTLAVIKTIYRELMIRNLVENSPATLVKTPRVSVVPRNFLTYEEILKRDFGKYQAQVEFLALHGLRWGEAVALGDSDLRDGKIFVTKSIHGETKTRSGVRVVPQLSTFAPLSKSPKGLRRALNRHGVHIHSLRHTYAYLLKSSGVHVTTAQRLMGHADPRVTLGIYTQFRDEEIDQAAELINKFRGRA